MDGSEILDEPQRRRSSRLRDEPIPRVNLLSSDSFLEAQAQRIVDWSLSRNYLLTPHLVTPSIFVMLVSNDT